MLSKIRMREEKGFTLVELMIVVAIFGVLAAIAIPNFIAYRNKARIAACVGTTESMRGAFAAYAADSQCNGYPDDTTEITNWTTLRTVMAANGTSLKALIGENGYATMTYDGIDVNGDNCVDDYALIVTCAGVPAGMEGSTVEVKPSGIDKQTS